VPNAEAISFMPYENELEELREMANAYEGADVWKYRFIFDSDKSALPYLPDSKNCKFKNLNKFEFEVPQKDIDELTAAVESAIELRND